MTRRAVPCIGHKCQVSRNVSAVVVFEVAQDRAAWQYGIATNAPPGAPEVDTDLVRSSLPLW